MTQRRRVPVRTQVSQTECGLASSLAVLESYGRFQSLAEARESCEPGRNGLSVAEIKQFFLDNGCTVRAFSAGTERLSELRLPLILHWKGYHFVVLESITHRGAVIMDPAVGRRRILREELGEGYSGIAIEAVPGEDFEPQRKPRFHEWRLRGLEWNIPARPLAYILLISLLSYALTLAIPIVTSTVIDRAITGPAALGQVWQYAFLILIAAGAAFILAEVARAWFTSVVVRAIGAGLMSSVFTRLLRLPLSFFSTRVPGELMYRVGTVNYVRDTLSTRIVQSIFDVGMLVIVLGYIWWVSPLLGGISTGMVVALLAFLVVTRPGLTRAMDSEINALTLSQGVQYDAISAIAQVKMGGYAEHMEERWSREYANSLSALQRRMMWQMGAIGSVSTAFQLVCPLALVLLGLQLFVQNAVELGAVVSVMSLAGVVFASAAGLLNAYTDMRLCSTYLGRLEDIVGTTPEPEGGTEEVLGGGDVKLRNVTFKYANETPAPLNDISLSVSDRETVAIVGESGSGKSTLAKVLCGLYRPTQGSVLIDGRHLDAYNLNSLRRQIGYVPQDVYLHNGTILENLSMGTDREDEDIVEFCNGLGFLDFIDYLPMGYRTMVSDMGSNFSGGQKQRIAIARILLRQPRIVVLDEATSALDRFNERRVNRIIDELGCTKIVIAHRLETIENADRIVVMANGSIAESGSHEELLFQEGHYAALYQKGLAA